MPAPRRLLEILNDCSEYLKNHGVESPRLQAELLMGHVLNMPRLHLYLNFEREISEETLAKLRPLLKRRGQREPIQHITGETSFCGLTLKCSPAALIPRPETELLVELVVKNLREVTPGLIYDVGTGSGALALALASQLAGWRVVATDNSNAALELAKENHARTPQLAVSWLCQSLLENQTKPAAAVVANLPYLTTEEMKNLPTEVRADPPSALHGGEDGLDFIRQLLPQAAQLAPRLFLEIGPVQAETMKILAQQAGFASVSVELDLAERPRFIVAVK
ncbi:MAG: peptide chain release factor N(5)-glutamine methyltransferase [bacterium]